MYTGFAAKPFMVLYETSTTPAMDSCLFASQLINLVQEGEKASCNQLTD
jgi:hypothetical protein